MTIYDRAADLLAAGDSVGLGSGRASLAFIRVLAGRIQAGLRVRCVPTSLASEELARSLGVPLVPLAEAMPLTLTVDGADEVAPNLDLVKGWGRALVREKVLAAASKRLIILAGKDKAVATLGQRGKLPVEVVPFALPFCHARLTAMNLKPVVWQDAGGPLTTDNGNHILDCMVGPITDPAALEADLRAIPGVVGTGLFLGLAERVLFGDQDHDFALVDEKLRPQGDDDAP